MSKAGGGNREGGRGGRWEVQQLQHSHANTAAPREHAGGCDPFVAAGVVLLDGVEAGAAVVTSHCIQPSIHSHEVMGAPGGRKKNQIQYLTSTCIVHPYLFKFHIRIHFYHLSLALHSQHASPLHECEMYMAYRCHIN